MIAKLIKQLKRKAYQRLELPLKRKFYPNTKLSEREHPVLDALLQNGIAVLNLSDLFEPTLLEELTTEFMQFYNSPNTQQIRAENCSGSVNNMQYKNYNLRSSTIQPLLSAQSAILKIGLSEQLGKIASAYFKELALLRYADYWLSMPIPKAERNYSQNWHRDPEDQQILKVFVYFNNVDENNGAFEYIKGSHQTGPYNAIFPYDKEHPNNYPDEADLRQAIPADAFTINSGLKGTVIVCDTHGFHRGGYCKTADRWLMTFMFNRASLIISNQFKVTNTSNLTPIQKKYYATFG